MNIPKVGLLLAAAGDFYNKNGWGSEYAANALHNMQNFISSQSFMSWPFNTIKWWLIKLFYGLANAASEILNKMLNITSFLNTGSDPKSELGQFIHLARNASFILLAVALVIMGIQLMVSRRPPEIKNIVIQAVVAVFLILEIGPATNWVVKQSTGLYHSVVETKGAKGTSSIPFEVLRSTTNDVEYLVSNNFTPTPASVNQTKIKGAGNYTKPINPPRVKYGYNDLSQSEVDHGDVPFDQIITWNDVDSNMPLWKKDKDMGHNDSHKGKYFLFAWLMHQPQTMNDKNNKPVYLAPDIQRIGGTGDGATIWSFGGYPRFNVDFLPTLITLGALAVAFLFAGYAIVKAVIELGLMQILSVFLFSTDSSEGQRTKRVITQMFSLSLLIGLQGIEIAFYKIVMLWSISAKNNGTFGSGLVSDWSFVVITLAATFMLMTGSQQVATFFGVDTGAQRGLRSAMMTGAAGLSIARNTGRVAQSATRAARRGSNALRSNADESRKHNAESINQKVQSNDNQHSANERPNVNEDGSARKVNDFANETKDFSENQSANGSQSTNSGANDERQNNMSNRAERNATQHASAGGAVEDSRSSSPKVEDNRDTASSNVSSSSSNNSSSSNVETSSSKASTIGTSGNGTGDSPKTSALRRQLKADLGKQKAMYAAPERYTPAQVQKQDDLVQKERRDLRKSELADRANSNNQNTATRTHGNVQTQKISSLQGKPEKPAINKNIEQPKPEKPATNKNIEQPKQERRQKIYRPEDDPSRPRK